MWNLYPASKIISERQKKRNYEQHLQKLTKMRPMMKILPPAQPEFVYAKHKQQMSRRDRQIEIDQQNQILLAKMQKISEEEYTTNRLRPEAQHLKTLNQHVMNQQATDIYNQNKRICQKLLRVHSHYPTFQIIDKTEELERVRYNISENARRVQSAAHLRPQSSLTHRSSKFYRSRVNKFDQEGNNTQQAYQYFQFSGQNSIRPESAPSKQRYRRPYSSQNSNRRGRKTAEEHQNAQEEKQRQLCQH